MITLVYVLNLLQVIEDWIETKASDIRQQFNSDNVSPFPFENITNRSGDLQIIGDSDLPEGISGAIIYKPADKKFVIVFNTNKPKTRQYFTIAHELGHYFLHGEELKSEEILVDTDNSVDGSKIFFRLDNPTHQKIETEANKFAAALLMPQDLVIKAWQELGNVEECANIFNVSLTAMSIRLEKLNLITPDA